MKEFRLLNMSALADKITQRLIEESDFFNDFSDDEIEILTKKFKAYTCSAGHMVLNENDKNNCLCIITKGKINIFRGAEYDEHIKVAEIRAGESIGEIGIIDNEPFSASAITSEKSEILIMSRRDFEDIVTEHKELGNKLLWILARILAKRLRQTTKHLSVLLADNK